MLVLQEGSGGGATATAANNTASSTTPTASTNAAPTQQGAFNFGGMNPNSMANMMNSMGGMGGMPDMATFQQMMQENPQMMQEMMNNPMVRVFFCQKCKVFDFDSLLTHKIFHLH